MKKIAVIGIGNILLRDDGVGVHTVRELEKEISLDTVEFVDGGTSTLDMLGYFLNCDKVIVVDALKAGCAPGTIYKIDPKEIENYSSSDLSIHDVQVLDVVKMANMMGKYPEVLVFGIEPEEVMYNLEMSDTIKNKVPHLVKLIKDELNYESL